MSDLLDPYNSAEKEVKPEPSCDLRMVHEYSICMANDRVRITQGNEGIVLTIEQIDLFISHLNEVTNER